MEYSGQFQSGQKKRAKMLFKELLRANENKSEEQFLRRVGKLMGTTPNGETKEWLVNAAIAIQSIIRDPKSDTPSSRTIWAMSTKNVTYKDYLMVLAYNFRERIKKSGRDVDEEIRKLKRLRDKPLNKLWRTELN
ncbi:MAG: hypothetical protein KGH94_05100 [Candidatus Micrarchaeota archaeon]|nr:hypothetical protein [Candidatus Micrarchaeota archaeon]